MVGLASQLVGTNYNAGGWIIVPRPYGLAVDW